MLLKLFNYIQFNAQIFQSAVIHNCYIMLKPMFVSLMHSFDIHIGPPSSPPQIRPVVDERSKVSVNMALYRSEDISMHQSLEQMGAIECHLCNRGPCNYACMYVRMYVCMYVYCTLVYIRMLS